MTLLRRLWAVDLTPYFCAAMCALSIRGKARDRRYGKARATADGGSR